MSAQVATFAAGCFWGVEQAFRQMEGVVDTAVGYIGGEVEEPTYEQVCTDQTGHAEAVQVTFDPDQVTYRQLLERFFELHDPTQVDRQGPDIGRQYRSEIFVHSPEQQREAETVRQEVDEKLDRDVATVISEAPHFWPAEDYHQQYLAKRGQAACASTIRSSPDGAEDK